MSNFIGYTIGLNCRARGVANTKVEYSRVDANTIQLQAVSGLNLGSMGPKYRATISKHAFQNRPHDAYDSSVEAIWALAQVGLRPAAMNDD